MVGVRPAASIGGRLSFTSASASAGGPASAVAAWSTGAGGTTGSLAVLGARRGSAGPPSAGGVAGVSRAFATLKLTYPRRPLRLTLPEIPSFLTHGPLLLGEGHSSTPLSPTLGQDYGKWDTPLFNSVIRSWDRRGEIARPIRPRLPHTGEPTRRRRRTPGRLGGTGSASVACVLTFRFFVDRGGNATSKAMQCSSEVASWMW